VGKFDQAGNGESSRGAYAHSAIAVGYFDALEDAKELAWSFSNYSAGLFDQFDKGLGAAIQDRDFEGVDFDDTVVYVTARQSGEQMLDRRYHYALPHQRRGIAYPGDVLWGCRYLKVVEIDPAKHVPGIGRGGTQCDFGGLSGVQPVAAR
jgi:hypothetical protein